MISQRDRKNCVCTVFDNKNWIIIDLELKKRGKIDNPNTNYEGSSIGMETAVIREIVPCLKNSFKIKLLAIVITAMEKYQKSFVIMNGNTRVFLDINHAMLSFGKSFEMINGRN